MKIWALAGLFTVLAAPNAFALGSLTDAPPELRDGSIVTAELSVREPESARQRLGAKQGQPASEQERRTTPRRRQEAQVEPQRPNEARRRRNGALDRVPDAVLIERSGAL